MHQLENASLGPFCYLETAQVQHDVTVPPVWLFSLGRAVLEVATVRLFCCFLVRDKCQKRGEKRARDTETIFPWAIIIKQSRRRENWTQCVWIFVKRFQVERASGSFITVLLLFLLLILKYLCIDINSRKTPNCCNVYHITQGWNPGSFVSTGACSFREPVTKAQSSGLLDSVFKDNFSRYKKCERSSASPCSLYANANSFKGCSTWMGFDDCFYRDYKRKACPQGAWNIDLGIWDNVIILFITWSWHFTFTSLTYSKIHSNEWRSFHMQRIYI